LVDGSVRRRQFEVVWVTEVQTILVEIFDGDVVDEVLVACLWRVYGVAAPYLAYCLLRVNLDDFAALKALISQFREAEKAEADEVARQISVNPLSKRLFLGHIIGREGSTDTASGSRQS